MRCVVLKDPCGRQVVRHCPTSGSLAISVAVIAVLAASFAHAETPAASEAQPDAAPQSEAVTKPDDNSKNSDQQSAPTVFDIDEFRVEGAKSLSQTEVEEAVYPYVGPNKTAKDVEAARAAVEKKYHDRGLQTVSVAVRYQNTQDRYVALAVTELKVDQLRVRNSKYHDLDEIKAGAPSLAPHVLPDFNGIAKDNLALNQWPDRRVTPALRAGVTPGTVDVDLNVEDKLPFHASAEINNRQSPNTSPLRFNTTLSYGNLWQLGHSLSFTYQTAPERQDDVQAFSGSYLARIPGVDWLSFLVYGVDSSSDVALLGDMNVVGPGQIIGTRAVVTLPSKEGFFHTLSAGIDYKHFEQTVKLGADSFDSPITYYPVVASYYATWQQPEKSLTELNATISYGLRGLGSDTASEWDAKRYKAAPNFFILSGSLAETYELPRGFQLYGKISGQIADQPLVSSEEFSLGGEQTVRGYLESSWLGDNGGAATIELRTPNIGAYLQDSIEKSGRGLKNRKVFNDWRLFTFIDAGIADIYDPLPDQKSSQRLWSYGVGTTFKMFDALNGMVAMAVPENTQDTVKEGEPRVLFRIWGEY